MEGALYWGGLQLLDLDLINFDGKHQTIGIPAFAHNFLVFKPFPVHMKII